MENEIEFDCWCPECGHEFNHRTHSTMYRYVFCTRCDYDFDSRDFNDCCKLIGGVNDSQS